MQDISHHIIEAYHIHRLLTNKQEENELLLNKGVDKRKPYHKLQYADSTSANPIKNTSNIENYSKFKKKNPRCAQIQSFIANLDVTADGEHMRSITWLEMYIVYRIRGYHKPIADSPGKADPRATAFRQTGEFQRLVKSLTNRTLQTAVFLC